MSGIVSPSGANDTVHPQRPGAPVPDVRRPGERRPGERKLLAGLGLLAVAVISGFVWWLIRYQPPPDPAPVAQPPAKVATEAPPSEKPAPKPSKANPEEFVFAAAATPDVDTDCTSVSYGSANEWFATHPCDRVVRALYTTGKTFKSSNKDVRALVSVIVVTMPTAEEAQEVKDILDSNGTGNISDMVRDGTVEIRDAPDVADGTYDSTLSGRRVTIVEAAFFDNYRHTELLADITAEALRMATLLR